MEPEIRFFTSHDGVRLAYTAFGDGPPLVQVPRWAHCIEWMSKEPEIGQFYEKLSRRHRVIILERRGTGASQRDVQDFSMAAHVGDVRALVEHLKLPRFALFGAGDSGGVCIAYAAEHSDEVSRLIVWGSYAREYRYRAETTARQARESDLPALPNDASAVAWIALIRDAWPHATRLIADSFFPDGPPELQGRTGKLWLHWMSSETALKYFGFAAYVDVYDLLPQISMPTLVLHRRDDRTGHAIENSQEIAAGIPNARFVAIDGNVGIAEVDHEQVLAAIESFLAEDEAPHPPALPKGGGTAIVLFVDVADSTALTERMGDAAFRGAARALDEAMRGGIRDAGGTPVEGKVLGDGVMAVFLSAAQGIDAARRCADLSAASELRLHIGLHAGDVLHEADGPSGQSNVYGGAVNIAARICASASRGRCWCRGRCAIWRGRRRGCCSRIGGSSR